MAKEILIKKKVIQILEAKGWINWYPGKVKYKQNDIFGVIDLLALKGKRKKNIQITTSANLSARRKKIIAFYKKFKVELPIEIWAWNSIKKTFKIEKVNHNTQIKKGRKNKNIKRKTQNAKQKCKT